MKFKYTFFALVTTLAISAMPAVGETTIRATGLVSTNSTLLLKNNFTPN